VPEELRKAEGDAVRGGYDPARVQSIVDRLNVQFMAEGGRPKLPADRSAGFKQPGAAPDDRLARFGSSFVSSLPGAASNVATGYWDMLSALNTYLYQLEPAEQIALLKQLPAGLRDMVLKGVESVKQIPEKVAAATPESAGQFGAQLTAEMLLDPTRLGKGAPKAEIMKNPGGNWEAGSVERVVDRLRPRGPKNRDEALATGTYYWTHNIDTPKVQKAMRQNAAISDWLDKKLNNYIKNDMATERDPVRLGIEQRLARAEEEKAKADLRNAKMREKISAARAQGKNTTAAERQLEQDIADAEQDYRMNQTAASHMRVDQARTVGAEPSEALMTRRIAAGAPPENLATTDLSAFWEKRADITLGIPMNSGAAVSPNFWLEPQDYERFMQNNPWALKVPPDTKIYSIQPNSERALHFDHLRDELEFALYDRANLPPELRLTPEDLSKMNMDAAVAHVGKMNAWRERNKVAANLLRSRNAATVTFKEYPEAGLEWKELKMPGEEQGGRATLEEALGYEGDVMGHCVGGRGYCDKVTSGEGRIFSLRDAKGEPHVTIEVKPSMTASEFYHSENVPESLLNKLSAAEASGAPFNWEQIVIESPEYNALPKEILQIKGKGNLKPADKYIPFVQDFVRSQQFANIRDFDNTDLIDLTRVRYFTRPGEEELVKSQLNQGKKLVTKAEWDEITKDLPPIEKRATGGAVSTGKMGYNAAAVDAIVQSLSEKLNG